MLPTFLGYDKAQHLIFAPHLPGLKTAYVLRPADVRKVRLLGGCVVAWCVDFGTMVGNTVTNFPIEISPRTQALRLASWLVFIITLYTLATWRLIHNQPAASAASLEQASTNRLRLPLMSAVLGVFLLFPVYIGLHIVLVD